MEILNFDLKNSQIESVNPETVYTSALSDLLFAFVLAENQRDVPKDIQQYFAATLAPEEDLDFSQPRQLINEIGIHLCILERQNPKGFSENIRQAVQQANHELRSLGLTVYLEPDYNEDWCVQAGSLAPIFT
jgi:hypothetical protein